MKNHSLPIWIALVTLLGTSPLARAHLELGTYEGTDASGKSCSFQVLDQRFEGGIKNPLNERVLISSGGSSFTLSHPPVVRAEEAVASFTHGILQGVVGTESGGMAFVLQMNSESHRPEAFSLVSDDWKSGQKSARMCSGLSHRD